MTKELIELLKDRDYFYRKAKKGKDKDSWNIAKYLRNVANSSIRQAKRGFILKELEDCGHDAKTFWKMIREVIPSGKLSKKQDIRLKDNKNEIERSKTAHFINDYFINIGNVCQSDVSFDNPPLGSLDPGAYQLHSVRELEVHKIIKSINITKSSGLDNINSMVIKETFAILLPEVTRMFNLSIQTTKFPDAWKKASVVPIPKTGDLTNIKNYRPISLLPLPGKVLEKLIHQQLSHHLESNALLASEQHGFRNGHSTLHSAAQLTNFVSKKLDRGTPTLVAYIDFRKAFDCVQHSLLINKLKSLQLSQDTVNWVESYLEARQQKVLANGAQSSYQTVSQGVPQGSVLGPLLYIIYANELPNVAKKCKAALYADDTVLYTANKDFQTSVADLQQDINAISNWCRKNGIKANTEKTKVMVFGGKTVLSRLTPFQIQFDGVPLDTVSTYKYLGITLDSQLNYNKHVQKIVSCVSGKLKQFQRMRSFLNIKAALSVYKGTILPILEYGDIFLDSTSLANRKKLQVLQNRGLRCALNKGVETSSDELHEEAKLLKLKFRRRQHLLNFMYDMAQDNQLLKKRKSVSVKTRSHNKKLLAITRPRTEKFKKSLAYRGPRRWNLLPTSFHRARTKMEYKGKVKRRVNDKAAEAQLYNVAGSVHNFSDLNGI